METQSVISDLTDTDFNNSIFSESIDSKIQTYFINLDSKLNDMNKDEIKDLCTIRNLSPKSKFNKQELKELVTNEFKDWIDSIKKSTAPKLKEICKDKKLSGYSTLKKDELILFLANFFISQIEIPNNYKTNNQTQESSITQEQTNLSTKKSTKKLTKKISDFIESETSNNINLDQEIARLLAIKAEQEEKAKLEAEERARQEAEDKAKLEAEEKAKLEAEEKARQDTEKKKKQQIPKQVKTAVWDLYIGSDIVKHRCLCCKKSYIKNTEFQVGHVVSEKDGGTLEISNLRPICAPCNFSMGTENMIDYIKKYGYYM